MRNFKQSFAGQGTETVYTNAFDYSTADNITNIECTLNVTAASGTPTLDVTPQYSYDGTTWFDNPTSFTQATGVTSESLDLNFTGLLCRFKIVVAGTTPSFDFTIYACVK